MLRTLIVLALVLTAVRADAASITFRAEVEGAFTARKPGGRTLITQVALPRFDSTWGTLEDVWIDLWFTASASGEVVARDDVSDENLFCRLLPSQCFLEAEGVLFADWSSSVTLVDPLRTALPALAILERVSAFDDCKHVTRATSVAHCGASDAAFFSGRRPFETSTIPLARFIGSDPVDFRFVNRGGVSFSCGPGDRCSGSGGAFWEQEISISYLYDGADIPVADLPEVVAPVIVPEPGVVLLMITGCVALYGRRKF